MPEQEPGWFYIGNGQLRYKDSEGWTDQYEDLDGPARTPDVGPPEPPDVPEPVTGKAVRGPGAHDLLTFIRRCAATAYRLIAALGCLIVAGWRVIVASLQRLFLAGWRVIATGYREVSAKASRRAIARRPRHRG
jgi:hypothetical protein